MLNAFRSQARKELTDNASDGTPVAVMGSSRMLPFVPIPREDLHLPPEAVLLLEKAETHRESLIFADEVDLAALLLGAMLLDTVNLDPNAGRAAPRDVDIDHRLLEIMGQSPSIEYNELVRARTSVDGLTNDQLL